MQIETATSHHLKPVRTAIVKRQATPSAGADAGRRGPPTRLAGPWTGAGPVGNSVRVPRTIEKQPPVIERLLSWTPVRGKQTSHGGGTPDAQPIAHHGQGVHRRVNTGGVTHAVGSVTTCTYPCVMTPATSRERMSTPCAHTGGRRGRRETGPGAGPCRAPGTMSPTATARGFAALGCRTAVPAQRGHPHPSGQDGKGGTATGGLSAVAETATRHAAPDPLVMTL